jgi:hypothetical protein
MHILIIAVLVLFVLWLVSGHGQHRHHTRQGRRLNYGASLFYGPFVSYRIGRHTTIRERL